MSTQRRICQPHQSQPSKNQSIFSLKCLNRSTKSKLHVHLDFTTLKRINSDDSNNKVDKYVGDQLNQLLPGYSYSGDIEMLAFVAEGERSVSKYQNRVLFQQMIDKSTHQQQTPQQKKEPNPILMTPKPISTYCQLCRQSFDDYLQHIEHAIHKKKLQQSARSTKMIQNLVGGWQLGAKRARSQKIIRIGDEDEQVYSSNTSSKIRVIENQNTLIPTRLTSSIKVRDMHVGTSTSEAPKIYNTNKFSNGFK